MVTESKKSHVSRGVEGNVVWFAVVPFCVAIATYVGYFGLYLRLPLGRPQEWGEFGDYLGGLINPIIGLVTVLLVARTLRATRQAASKTHREMREQSRYLEKQINFYEKRERLEELRQRLAGVLLEWNSALEFPIGNLMQYAEGGGTKVDYIENKTVRDVFYDPAYIASYTNSFGGSARSEVLAHWVGRFGNFLLLMDELALYCAEYDEVAGEQVVTDFYRRRIQGPLKLFRVIGMLGDEEYSNLNIASKQRVFVQSNPKI